MKYLIIIFLTALFLSCGKQEILTPDVARHGLETNTLNPCADHRPVGFWELDYQVPFYYRFMLEVFNNVEATLHTISPGEPVWSQPINFRIPNDMVGCECLWVIRDVRYNLLLTDPDHGILTLEGDSTFTVILTRVEGLNVGDAIQNVLLN